MLTLMSPFHQAGWIVYFWERQVPQIPCGSAKAEHDSDVKGFKSQSPLALLPAAPCSQARISDGSVYIYSVGDGTHRGTQTEAAYMTASLVHWGSVLR